MGSLCPEEVGESHEVLAQRMTRVVDWLMSPLSPGYFLEMHTDACGFQAEPQNSVHPRQGQRR